MAWGCQKVIKDLQHVFSWIILEVQKPTLQLMYELKEALKQLFGCEVDLVRFRDSLRPLFKSNIQRDVIYVW